MCEDFNTTHSARVDQIIGSRKTWITYNGVDYPFYNNGSSILCVAKSPCYKIPPEIQELLDVKTIVKTRASSIRFELSTHCIVECYAHVYYNRIPQRYTSMPIRCQHIIDISEHYWVLPFHMRLFPNILCDKCYMDGNMDENMDENMVVKREDYVRFHPCDFRVMDWVQFATSDNHEFYVNCNPESAEYGNVIYGYYDSGYCLNTVGSVEDFVQLVYQWIAFVPSTPESVDIEALNEFLDSNCAELFIIDINRVRQTYRYILENQDAVVGMSEQLIADTRNSLMRYRNSKWAKHTFKFGNKSVILGELTDEEFEQCVLLEARDKSQRRLYSNALIDKVNEKLQTQLQYKHPKMRSFSTWLLSLTLPETALKMPQTT